MKKTIFLLVSMLAVVSCYDDSELRKQMQGFEERLSELTGTVIEQVDDQIESIKSSVESLHKVDNELDAYIKELEKRVQDLEKRIETDPSSADELKTIKATLEDLKTKDESFDMSLSALQNHVDESLKSSKDWAEVTFATFAQYESLQTELASIKMVVEGLASELAAAISASEVGMKLWVNEKLAEGYYDIAYIDAQLASLQNIYKDANEDLQVKITEQQTALEQVKKDLTDDYNKAIQKAIEENNGVLDSEIANIVKTAQEELQQQLNGLQDFIELMEERLDLLETDFVNRIQSLVFIPDFTDGKVAVYQEDGSFDVKFLVTPTRLASDIKTLWQMDKNILKAIMYYAADPQTRSADNSLELNVASVEADSEGLLYLTICADSKNPVKEEFWEGKIGAYACIRITDGNNDKASELFALEGKKGNSFPDHIELPIPEPGTPSGVSKTANCYVISEAGSYTIKTVKGNSVESVGVVAAAEVLWESFGTDVTPEVGDLIASVSYSNGRIGFVTAEPFREGNAVIAAKDVSGNILWSWHIWMTDKPEGQTYYNGAGTMMDRNLGATSATPGDVGALGLLYQWGRKDPFLGSSSISSSVEAASTFDWPEAITSDLSTGTIDYAIANPTVFICGNSDYYNDWHSENDDTRWQTEKTIYDPCPVGWRVPDGGGSEGVWSKALGSEYAFSGCPYDSANKGINFSGKFGSSSIIWYPASAERYFDLDGVGQRGAYWSVSSGINGAFLRFDSDGNVGPTIYTIRSWGKSVRCLKEGSIQEKPTKPDPDPEPEPEPTPDPTPEPLEGDYVDEYGINHGPGVDIDGVVWAPVNCGFHATDYQWGKLYQWGRKYGQGYSGDYYDNGKLSEISDARTPVIVDLYISLSDGQSIVNENTFFLGKTGQPHDGCDWLNSRDDSLWNSGTETAPQKTAYDPCPQGWRVPTETEFSVLLKCLYYDKDVLGHWFGESSEGPLLYLPTAGSRSGNDGRCGGRGSSGSYWSSTSETPYSYRSTSFSFNLNVKQFIYKERAYACSVRCVQEKR